MKFPTGIIMMFLVIATATQGVAQFNLRTKKKATLSIQTDIDGNVPLRKSRELQKAIRVPLMFAFAGLYSVTDDALWNKFEVQEERNEWIPAFRHRADDYLQYAPIALVYGLNALGVKGENDLANRTALLLKTELLVGILTYSLKKMTAIPRPDTGRPNSFPSGHTAQAFAAATFMAKEYGHKSIWYSIGAYTLATGIGTMRVLNNRHWISDVLVGAGIGIFSANFVYLTHQYKWGKKKNSSRTLVMPSYDGQAAMISLVHTFH